MGALAPVQASALPHTFPTPYPHIRTSHLPYLRLEALADRKALAPEQASVLRMLAWCRDFALLQLYEQVRASPHLYTYHLPHFPTPFVPR